VRRLSVRFLSLLVLTACRGGAGLPGASFAGASLLTPPSDAEAAHDELLRADLGRADSVARLGVAGLLSSFADDILYLRGGLPIVRGRAQVGAIVSAESLGTTSSVRWQPVRAEASADGRSGYTYGYAIYSAPAPGTPSIRVDRYIAFWRRAEPGWRIAAYAETYGSPPQALALPRAAVSGVVPDQPMSRAHGALEGVRDADVAFSRAAVGRGTGVAFGEFAAENAQIFSTPGEFITGPAAISDAFGPSTDGSSLAWHPVAGEAAGSGDLGFTVGNAVFTGRRADGAPAIRYSKYLTVWKKQRDGSWRYVVDGGSARPNE
jgi:ketosteroid isomerase-like protein